MDLSEPEPIQPAPGDDDPDQRLREAEALLAEDRVEAAEATLRAGVQRFPEHAWLATTYGNLLNRQGRWEDAEREWTRQIGLFPNHAPAYGGLALVFEQTGRPETAYAIVSQAVESCGQIFWLRLSQAHLSFHLRRDFSEAAEHWRAVVADFPDEFYPRLEEARARRASGDPAGAWQVLQEALEGWPDQGDLLVGALENLLDLGLVEPALDCWRRLQARGVGAEPLTPLDQSWRLYAALEDDPARVEPLTYILSEPDAGSDWRPVVVERIQVLPFGQFADRVRQEVRAFVQAIPAQERTLLHRMAWSLVYGKIGAAEAADNLRTSLQRAPWVTQVLLETWANADRTPLYAQAVREILPAEVNAQLDSAEPRYDSVLQALKTASVFDEATFEGLLAACARHLPDPTQLTPGTAAETVVATTRAHRPRGAGPRARTADRLRIAVCVSGQMRGYRDAFPSWSALGLQDHEAHYFVHTWKRVGGKPPELAHAYRSFEPAFAAAYTEVVTRLGMNELARRYPRLHRRAESGGETEVDAEDVRQLYGALDVRIDDEASAPFAGRSNFWKMHYKIREAHRLALASGVAFDLFVRIRPDREIAAPGFDWRAIADRCAADNLVYADEGRSIQSLVGYYMGDQFAVGARQGMDVYAGAFDVVERGGVFALPPDHVPHASLALATFHSGVRVERMPVVTFGEHKNASRMRNAEVEALLRADLGPKPPDEIDGLLLRSCSAAG